MRAVLACNHIDFLLLCYYLLLQAAVFEQLHDVDHINFLDFLLCYYLHLQAAVLQLHAADHVNFFCCH